MGFPAAKCATYVSLFVLPENLAGEIVNGHIVAYTRQAPRLARTAVSLLPLDAVSFPLDSLGAN